VPVEQIVESLNNPDRAKNRALDQLRRMGYAVTLEPLAAAG
jgi:hypothetical protein